MVAQATLLGVADSSAKPVEPVSALREAVERTDAQRAREVQAATQVSAPEAPAPEMSLRKLALEMDPQTRRIVAQVIDAETGEVVRRIPPEEWGRIQEGQAPGRGVLVDREG